MTITVDAVVQEVRKLASQKPDFNYHTQEGMPDRIGFCSYLAGMTEGSYHLLQEDGKFPEDLSFDEARHKGLVGQRCIVGQALHNLGVSDEDLAFHEGTGADYLLGYLLKDSELPKVSQSLWLNSVQAEQDVGKSWGEAVKIADKEYPNV